MLSTTHRVGVNHRHTVSPEETSTTPCEGTRTKHRVLSLLAAISLAIPAWFELISSRLNAHC
jgi:hypothetical protein